MITYRIRVADAAGHILDVQMSFRRGAGVRLPELSMPAWSPGSYKIRDFAKNIVSISSPNGRVVKKDKSTFRIETDDENISVNYRVYCNEVSVRTSHIDGSHAFLDGPSAFLLYLPGRAERHQVEIVTRMKVSTGKNFTADNYDHLVDCPIEISNFEEHSIVCAGIKHRFAVHSFTGKTPEQFIPMADKFKPVPAAAKKIFGELPYDRYTFITHIHERPSGGGGLEHRDSAAVEFGLMQMLNQDGRLGILSLLVHEYFHLFNVKRIKPAVFDPYGYGGENYTDLLWLNEGITDYYALVLMARAKICKPEKFLELIAKRVNSLEQKPGRKTQSLVESSYDTWIKFYQPNEDSDNWSISYYEKGTIIGFLLDLEIRRATGNRRSLDSVMRRLYKEKTISETKGAEEVFRSVAGKKISDFFRKFIYGVADVEYESLKRYGIEVARKKPENGRIGASLSFSNGRCMVSKVIRGGPSHSAGLSANDELISIDRIRLTAENANEILKSLSPGRKVRIQFTHLGHVGETPLTVGVPFQEWIFKPAKSRFVKSIAAG